jgi:hypothetical protein
MRADDSAAAPSDLNLEIESPMHRRARWTSDRLVDPPEDGPDRRPRLLLLCDFRPQEAATVIDHIEAIRSWSRYDVFVLPIFGDLPVDLDLDAFDGLVIHYNLVMSNPAYLSPLARWRISQFSGLKAAFIQDEYRFVNRSTAVMRMLGIQVLFTCVPQDQVDLVYPQDVLPELRRAVTVLTGYVPEELLSLPLVPYQERTTDVAYRGRRLLPWLGTLGQEKAAIGDRFALDAPRYGLAVDISSKEEERLYGTAWTDFLRHAKAMLGVESGASVFDFDGSIEREVRAALAIQPELPFEELHRRFLTGVDGRIRLNQISPRCFEAAAVGTLMVLYPGDYSGVLEPWRHYVALEKDHSNMDEVVKAIREQETWERITGAAREEVARNPRYSFRAMVETVDNGLDLKATAVHAVSAAEFERVASRSLARMPNARMRAHGLPPAINRLRYLAARAVQVPIPSPIAIPPVSSGPVGRLPRLRAAVRYSRALTYWAIRRSVIPSALLMANRRTLPGDLSEIGRLQAFGAQAVAAGAGSPFAMVLDHDRREVRITVRTELPPGATISPRLPGDLSWASTVSLHLTDPWLLPAGWEGSQPRLLEGLSAVIQARPEVGRRLLTGRARWCDVATVGEGEVRPPRAAGDDA